MINIFYNVFVFEFTVYMRMKRRRRMICCEKSCHSSPTLLCETPSPSNSNVVPLEGTLSFQWDKLKGWNLGNTNNIVNTGSQIKSGMTTSSSRMTIIGHRMAILQHCHSRRSPGIQYLFIFIVLLFSNSVNTLYSWVHSSENDKVL